MSSLQLVVYGVLWVCLMTLGALLLLLYRQVEKVYQDSYTQRNIPLAAGVEAPSIEIIDDDGAEAPLVFGSDDELSVVAFLMPSCSTCVDVVEVLHRDSPVPGRSLGVVLGEDKGEFHRSDSFLPVWAAHPPDVMRAYGVGQTPFAYVLRGSTVLAAKYVQSRGDLEDLGADALAAAATLDAELAEPQPTAIG
jgi:hypothetical protein